MLMKFMMFKVVLQEKKKQQLYVEVPSHVIMRVTCPGCCLKKSHISKVAKRGCGGADWSISNHCINRSSLKLSFDRIVFLCNLI